MILVDTSVWIDHFHHADPALVALLDEAQVCVHPLVIGELAVGSLRTRTAVLALLADLPGTAEATHAEVLQLVESAALHGMGLSLVDAHLLAGLRLSATDTLWSRDRRLSSAAERLGVASSIGR